MTISLCVCALMALGACEPARRGDTSGAAGHGRDPAAARPERPSSGAAVRFHVHVSEHVEPPAPDRYYDGPPRARARVPFVDVGPDPASVLMAASWLNEVSFGERSFTHEELAFKELLVRADAEAIFGDLLHRAGQARMLRGNAAGIRDTPGS